MINDIKGFPIHLGDLVKHKNRHWIVSGIEPELRLSAVIRVFPVNTVVDMLDELGFDVEILEGYDSVTLLESFQQRKAHTPVQPSAFNT
jgi:hypothetical protein